MVRTALLVLLLGNLILTLVLSQTRVSAVNATENADVRSRVKALDLTEVERGWEKVGWVTDMGRALELSARYQRPIFIIAGAGALDGRC